MNNSCTEEYKDEAIRRAEAASYVPGIGQRDINWENVQHLADLAQQNGNWNFLSGDEAIILGRDGVNKVVDNGMHRILASGMSGVPLPESMILDLGYATEGTTWSRVR